ncbi:hypothetical protein Salat_2960700 [Sesamum alatum]|uniref:Uncharacterized protein n=1 Tax=Sesamum alatum TaxID=300844 RepID=A0AAE2C833_9LAMI|nr:hypothetical protein Salat_2960700 [Sesamum alatum]
MPKHTSRRPPSHDAFKHRSRRTPHKGARACPDRHEDSERGGQGGGGAGRGEAISTAVDASAFAGNRLLASAPYKHTQLPCGNLACRDCRTFAHHMLLVSASRRRTAFGCRRDPTVGGACNPSWTMGTPERRIPMAPERSA